MTSSFLGNTRLLYLDALGELLSLKTSCGDVQRPKNRKKGKNTILFRPVSRIEVKIAVRASIFEFQDLL
jgi:hypothetical protein